MTCFTKVALRGSRRASTMPLTKHFSGAPHKLLAGFDGDHHQAVYEVATSKSNKHHRLATRSPSATRCNLIMQHTRITLTHKSIRTLASTSELEGIQALLHKPHRHEGAQQPAQGRPHTPFIAPRAKIAVIPSLSKARTDRTRRS